VPPSKPLRIGYILKMYPRFSETFILTEILAHEAAGAEVHIFSLMHPVDGHFHADLARIRAQVAYIPASGLKGAQLWGTIARAGSGNPRVWDRLPTVPPSESEEIYQAAAISEAVRQRAITHLHAHFATSAATVAMHAAAIADVPFSFTAHAKDIYIDSVDEPSLRRKLREASAVVTVSDYNLSYLRSRFGQDAATVRRIYNGLDLQQFAYCEPRERPAVILGIGRLVEKKGFDDLIRACDLLRARGREFRCQIIGDGPLAAPLTDLIARLELGDRVRMLGPLPRDQVILHLQNSAALAAPCIVGADGNRDGLPTVLLEAMALGTPCVATDVTGLPEVVRDGDTGMLVGERRVDALADALGRLLDDAALRTRLSRSARALIERDFDIHQNCARIREIFGHSRQASTQPAEVLA
jgi:colanic acid/amylovoran biosynthesis glycosyltransferase